MAEHRSLALGAAQQAEYASGLPGELVEGLEQGRQLRQLDVPPALPVLAPAMPVTQVRVRRAAAGILDEQQVAARLQGPMHQPQRVELSLDAVSLSNRTEHRLHGDHI